MGDIEQPQAHPAEDTGHDPGPMPGALCGGVLET